MSGWPVRMTGQRPNCLDRFMQGREAVADHDAHVNGASGADFGGQLQTELRPLATGDDADAGMLPPSSAVMAMAV